MEKAVFAQYAWIPSGQGGFIFLPMRNELHPKRTASVSCAFGGFCALGKRNGFFAALFLGHCTVKRLFLSPASAATDIARLTCDRNGRFWHVWIPCPVHPRGTAIAFLEIVCIPPGKGSAAEAPLPSPRPKVLVFHERLPGNQKLPAGRGVRYSLRTFCPCAVSSTI